MIEGPGGVQQLSCLEIVRFLRQDLGQVWKFGWSAPRAGQRIWIVPAEVEWMLTASISRQRTGSVSLGDWDQQVSRYADCPIRAMVWDRIWKGSRWEDSQHYSALIDLVRLEKSQDKQNRLLDKIRRKYEAVDRLICEVKTEGRLRTTRELGGYKEFGGVLIHVSRNSALVFGNGGRHRLAVAHALSLPSIPAQVGVVHAHALSAWSHRQIPLRRVPKRLQWSDRGSAETRSG